MSKKRVSADVATARPTKAAKPAHAAPENPGLAALLDGSGLSIAEFFDQ